jgi:hypothetical protein
MAWRGRAWRGDGFAEKFVARADSCDAEVARRLVSRTATMTKRVPTSKDYEAYDGPHCHQLWSALHDAWRCPGCARTKFEIMRWTSRRFKQGVGKCASYKGWMAGLHRHHDHRTDMLGVAARFEVTVLCDQCNSADGAAKKRLSLPPSFSFSPREIADFVRATPHATHKIDYARAQELFLRLSD